MNKRLIAVSAATLVLFAAGAGLPVRAADDLTFTKIFEMADKNKDTMVTKKEFLDAMSKAYDMKMQKFKGAKDTNMMKGDAMTREGLKSLLNDIHYGA